MDIDMKLMDMIENINLYRIISKPINNKFKNNMIDKTKDIEYIIKNIINNYISNINLVIPNSYLKILNNNILSMKLVKKDVKINEVINKELCSFYPGIYDCSNNSIIYFSNDIYKVLGSNYKEILIQVFNHEMLHLSSSIILNNRVYSGISIDSLGDYLNEGYTELINDRLLGNNIVLTNYEYEKRIALLLSNFVGNDKMLKCYFNANNRYFNKTLDKYSNSVEAYHILKIIDIIGENKKIKDLSIKKHNKLINYHIELTDYILKIHTNKLLELLSNNIMLLDDAIEDIMVLSLFMFNNAKFISSINKEDVRMLKEKITVDLLNKYINILCNYNMNKNKILNKRLDNNI